MARSTQNEIASSSSLVTTQGRRLPATTVSNGGRNSIDAREQVDYTSQRVNDRTHISEWLYWRLTLRVSELGLNPEQIADGLRAADVVCESVDIANILNRKVSESELLPALRAYLRLPENDTERSFASHRSRVIDALLQTTMKDPEAVDQFALVVEAMAAMFEQNTRADEYRQGLEKQVTRAVAFAGRDVILSLCRDLDRAGHEMARLQKKQRALLQALAEFDERIVVPEEPELMPRTGTGETPFTPH